MLSSDLSIKIEGPKILLAWQEIPVGIVIKHQPRGFLHHKEQLRFNQSMGAIWLGHTGDRRSHVMPETKQQLGGTSFRYKGKRSKKGVRTGDRPAHIYTSTPRRERKGRYEICEGGEKCASTWSVHTRVQNPTYGR